MQYGGGTAPTGWLLCLGQEVPIASYGELYTAIGTNYGALTNGSGAAGSTHFRVPDLQGRVAVGKGTHSSVGALGENDGTALNNRRPAHSHSGSATTADSGNHYHNGTTSTNGAHWHNYSDYYEYANLNYNYVRTGGGQGTANTIGANLGRTTDTQGSHNHTFDTSWGGTHNHTVSMTVGSSGGTTDSASYIVVNYIIKT